jgi:putative transposase
MDFASGHIYHVYNRGNNSQTIFYTRENYLFFLEKLRVHILSHADVLAWCLMPNHFHLMILVKQVEVEISEQVASDGVSEQVTLGTEFDPMTWAHRINNQAERITHPMNSSHRMSSKEPAKYRSLNDSIAIMLRSYTRAINKQCQKHGSIFEQHTKALCLTEPQGVSLAYFNSHFGMMGNLDLPETNYLNVCFDYIHQNPVGAKLVAEPEDWEFSSYRDYYCGRKGKLVNRELTKDLGLIE